LQATGISTRGGQRVQILDHEWRDLTDIEQSGRDVVRATRNLWGHGYDDVVVRRQAVMTIWAPHEAEKKERDEITSQPYQTGTPGRPTSMQLVAAEYRARWDRSEAQERIGAEAAALSQWLKETHPSAPQLTPKTICNNLRTEHRQRMNAARK